MKASKLIEELEEHIAHYGDKEVEVIDHDGTTHQIPETCAVGFVGNPPPAVFLIDLG